MNDKLKSKLAKEIDVRRKKLNDIFQQERIINNKNAIGKCFQEYFDTGNNYTRYTKVVGINEFGSLYGYYYELYDHEIKISHSKVYLPDADQLVKYGNEISLDKFFLYIENSIPLLCGELEINIYTPAQDES